MKENLLKIREELGEHLVPGEDEYYSSLRPADSADYLYDSSQNQSAVGQSAQQQNAPLTMEGSHTNQMNY